MDDSWRRGKAEEKIAEWSVERGSFVAALEKLVAEKRSAGEWKFNCDEEVALAIEGAKRFFDEFSCKLVGLSDGRCVYFVPDERAKARLNDIAFCWAEYAFHSVSSGGEKIPGKSYNFRKYNEYKVANADLIESTLLAERCVPVLKGNRKMDSVKFFGSAHLGGVFDVVVRLDDFGNANANLTEVTFEANSKKKQKNMPQLVSLAEAIRTVVSHQTATGTYPPNESNITNSMLVRKGGLASSGNTDIAVIILIGKEKIHLKRCVEKLAPLNPRQIFLVESQPDDGGVAIAKETAAKLGLMLESKFNKWPGNQAAQFNWALGELEVKSKSEKVKSVDGQLPSWILRLDADEYVDEKGIEWLKANLESVPDDVDALEFTLERKFMGGVIRHATNGIKMVRMFRVGRAKYAETLMDERLIYEGKKLEVPVVFWDDNLNDLARWKNKHRGYAKREAEQAIAGTFQDPRKAKYYKMPRYVRALAYFCIRYFLKGGFLDGKAGWRWNFWQGLWYRWIVDREIGRISGSGKW